MAVDVAVTSVNLDHLYAKTHEEKSLDNVNDILLGSLREWSAEEDDLFSTLFSIGDDKSIDMIVESPRSDSSSSDSYLTPISPDSAYLSPDDSFVPSPSEMGDPNCDIVSTTSSDELPTEDNFLIDMNIDWSSFKFPDKMFDIKDETSGSDLGLVTSSLPVSTTTAVKVEDVTSLTAVRSTTPIQDTPSICAPTTTSSCKTTSLVLSTEEKRLLQAEGVVLPTDTTLTKAEEKVLKKVRRKIKNKQSAQESRKKKKCYVDGLELRVKACTDENRNLQDKVKLLENQNKSLLQQLKQLQAAIAISHPNKTQAGTCLMVLMLAFGLVFFPVNNIWSPNKSSAANYAPVNVRSRTLLQVNEDYLQAEEGLGTGSKYSSINVSDLSLDTKLVSPLIDNALSDISFKVVSHEEAQDGSKETMPIKTEKR